MAINILSGAIQPSSSQSLVLNDEGGSSALTIDTDGNTTLSGDLVPNTPLSHRNLLINGGFDVWQRETTFSSLSTSTYTADRWQVYAAGTSTITATRQTFSVGQTDVAGNPKYYLRIDNTPDTGTSWMEIFQRIEDVTYFSGVNVTLSFYIKSNKNITNNTKANFYQNFGSGGSTQVTTSSSNFNITTSWAKKEVTVSLPSISGKTVGSSSYLEVRLLQDSIGAIAADTTIDFAQMQLELGSVATPFEHRSYGDELAMCQRYYEKSYSDGVFPGASNSDGLCVCDSGLSSTNYRYFLHSGNNFKVTKRAFPALTLYSSGGTSNAIRRYNSSTEKTVDSIAGEARNSLGYYIQITPTSAGDTSEPYTFQWIADSEL